VTLCLTDREAAAAASWPAKIDAVAAALRDCGAGAAISGARVDYHFLPGGAGLDSPSALLDFRTMFGLWPARRIAALRVANHTYSFPSSPSQRVTTEAVLDGGRIPAFVLVFDTDTGRTLALIPDETLQRDRVAATAAVGARLLARPESRSLGLIGTGRIAERYVAALGSVLPLEQLTVFSPTAGHAAAFARAMTAEHGLDAAVASAAEEAAEADVVCVATNSREPVLRG
jgi:ornithine cyclodeaminase/alanine dehydrogenase-like protein (mu-crystallin family)